MPSSLPLAIILLFLFIYLPYSINKAVFNKQLPLARMDLHFADELSYFYFPTVLFLLILSGIYYLIGQRLNEDLVLAALGNTSFLNRPLLQKIERTALVNISFIMIECLVSGLYGYRHAKYRIDRLKSNFPKYGRSPFDPWFCLFIKGEGDKMIVDILTKGKTLYSGELLDYHRTKDGEITGFTLSDVTRYKKHPEEMNKPTEIRPIPGTLLHIYADDVSNINLRLGKEEKDETTFFTDFLTTDPVKEFNQRLQQRLHVRAKATRTRLRITLNQNWETVRLIRSNGSTLRTSFLT